MELSTKLLLNKGGHARLRQICNRESLLWLTVQAILVSVAGTDELMSFDISEILSGWEFDPDDQYRVIQATDGREVLQVRQPLGIEQYELDGRPDGDFPFGKDSMLDEIIERLSAYRQHHGDDVGFTIDHDDFSLLQSEGTLFYYRYYILFQIGDYERTVMDTNHNLKICELVERYSQLKDKEEFLQYRPYMLRVNATARAMVLLEEGQHLEACSVLECGIENVRLLPEMNTPTFHFERVRSLQYLRAALGEIETKKIHIPIDRLRNELSNAVINEEYERAAQIRDQIRDLTDKDDDQPAQLSLS